MELNHSLEDSIILYCCCAQPLPEQIKTIDQKLSGSIDWDYICHIAKYHNISSLIYNNLSLCNNRSIIPSNVYEKLHKEYTTTAIINLLFIREYEQIVKALNIQNIKLIPLKGISFLKDLYANIALRSLMDIDILIQQQDTLSAQNILKDMGYEIIPHMFYLRGTHFHNTFIRTTQTTQQFSCAIEIHWDIDFSDSAFNITINDFWQRAEPITEGSLSFYKLPLEDSILLNCFHIFRDTHNQTEIISLKNLCDLSEIIKRDKQKINFKLVLERAENYCIKRPVLLVLFLVQELLLEPMPFDVLDCIKKEGFNEKMVDALLTGRIFIKAKEPFSLPGGCRLSANGKSLSLSLSKMIRELYMRVRVKYDTHHSLRKSLLPIFRTICASLNNYITVLFLYFFDHKNTRQNLKNKINRRDSLTNIDAWLRGSTLQKL